MAQQIMWIHMDSLYRGQATNGTVVSIEEDAMDCAMRKAGRTVYDTDWWVETVERVLEHWGLRSKSWIDASTQTPRMHFGMSDSKFFKESEEKGSKEVRVEPAPRENKASGVRTTPLGSGPLTARLISGGLSTRDLEKPGEK